MITASLWTLGVVAYFVVGVAFVGAMESLNRDCSPGEREDSAIGAGILVRVWPLALLVVAPLFALAAIGALVGWSIRRASGERANTKQGDSV